MHKATYSAIVNDQYPIVEYFIKTGHGRHALTQIDIIHPEKRSLEMIRLCHANDVKMEATMMMAAAKGNQIEAMELMVHLGAPMDADMCNTALTEEAYEAYLWLRKAGCPQNERTEELLHSAPEFVWKESAEGSTAASATSTDRMNTIFRRYLGRKINSKLYSYNR